MAPDLVDIRTIFLVTTLVSVTTALATLFLWRSHPDEQSLPVWTLGSLLVAVGYLGILMRDWLPLFVSISLANAAITAGHACFLNGFQRLTGGRPLAWHAILALSAAIAASFAYFTFEEGNMAARMSIQFAALVLLALASAYRLLKTGTGVTRLTHRTVAGVFAIFGLALLLRVAWMPFDLPDQNLFAHNPVHNTVFIVMLLFYAALMYCFPALLYAKDNAQRKQAESDLRIAAAAFESQEGMVVTDANKIILRANRGFTEITGYPAEEIIGRKMSFLRSGHHDNAFYVAMWNSIAKHGSWQGEIWNRNKDGEIHPHWLTISTVKDDSGKVTHYIGAYTDITERKEEENRIRSLAFYDPLTRLPNRRLMLDRLEQALAGSARHHRRGAVMLLDLDYFKTINDTLGHETGDQLLILVAQRLSETVRQSDLVARLGGDEFVVVLIDIESPSDVAPSDVAHIAGKIVARISEPFLIGVQEVTTSPSIGICLYPDDATDSRALLKQADVAMYAAKARGRGNFQFYTEAMQIASANRLAIEADLGSALAAREFTLHYQPQLDMRTHRPICVEALVRWQHPRRGLLEPPEFLSIAEEIGYILPLGEWMLEEACRQLAAWRADTHPDLRLAINLSASEFNDPDLTRRVRAALDKTGIPPECLEIEVTEATVLQEPEAAMAVMQALAGLGVFLTIDDFAAGVSSLSHLGRFPVGALKIGAQGPDSEIYGLAVTIAHRLGFEAVAKGVESAAQFAHLQEVGCDRAQGHLIGNPLPAEHVPSFLRDFAPPD